MQRQCRLLAQCSQLDLCECRGSHILQTLTTISVPIVVKYRCFSTTTAAAPVAVMVVAVVVTVGLYMGPNNFCCVTPPFLLFFLCPMSLFIKNLLRHVTFYKYFI